MEKQNEIKVEHGDGGKIARVFGVTNAMVSKALKGKGYSDLARKIRHVALTQYKGREMVEVKQINNQ